MKKLLNLLAENYGYTVLFGYKQITLFALAIDPEMSASWQETRYSWDLNKARFLVSMGIGGEGNPDEASAFELIKSFIERDKERKVKKF